MHEKLLLSLACDSSSEGDHIVDTVKENIYKYKYTYIYIYTHIQTVYIRTYILHNIIYEEQLINKSSDKVNLTV